MLIKVVLCLIEEGLDQPEWLGASEKAQCAFLPYLVSDLICPLGDELYRDLNYNVPLAPLVKRKSKTQPTSEVKVDYFAAEAKYNSETS